MNLDLQSLMYAITKAQEAYGLLNQYKENADEDMRRKELRKNSIDVEFRVIEE
jgi:hypothetical protein